jgi:spermidine synthase
LIRLAISIALDGIVFLAVARLLPLVLLQAGRYAPRLAAFLLIAALGATALTWLAARVAAGPGPGRLATRFAIVAVGEVGLLFGLLAVAPTLGVNFAIGDPSAAAGTFAPGPLVVLAGILAAGALAADAVARWTSTWLRRAIREADPTRTAIFGIFVLSGAAGLMYEVVWARQLVLVFGNTTQAVSAILTGYFGGLAIGSVVGGRIADRVARPLRLYGILEIILVAVVLLTPLLFRGLHEVYRAGYAGLEDQPTALALLRYGLALLALAPATVLMGATLPTLSRHLSRRRAELGSTFGRLYTVNTIGAIVGTALAGLVLIELVGLTGTLVVGAACSGAAGLAAIGLDLRDRTAGRHTDAELAAIETMARAAAGDDVGPPSAEGRSGPAPGTAGPVRERATWAGRRLPILVAFVSGLTSLGYQLLWTRLLASGSGNTTYVFTAILVTFLIGIAIGAAIVASRLGRSPAWSGRAAYGRLGAIQVLIAAIVLAGLAILSGQVTGLPFVARVILVVLPATLAIGLTLPLASSLVPGEDEAIGRDAGLLLGANTLGAIGGTFVVPFVLIPTIGSPASLVVLAVVNLGLGLGLLARGRDLASLPRQVAAGAGTVMLVLAVVALAVPNPLVADPGATRLERDSILLADAEDEIAAVQAGGPADGRRLLVGGTGMTRLTVDAKIMAYLPLMTRPAAERMLVLCFGMGSTFRSGLIAGLTVDGVELVPSVRDMFGYFYPDAAGVLGDPNGRLLITDGRNHVELTDRTYDLITVDPPPPIESSGTSVLYSREFYVAAAGRLRPGGVMMEWMPYGQTVDEFRSHVRTFADVFPEVLIAFGPTERGVYMLGSDSPIAIEPDAVREVLERPGVVEDLIATPDNLASTAEAWVSIIEDLAWIEGDQARAFGAGAAVILDDRPVTEYFLIRRVLGSPSRRMNEANLREATPPSSSARATLRPVGPQVGQARTSSRISVMSSIA